MKFLMIHLSDSHISSTASYNNEKFIKMIDALGIIKNVEEFALIFSGDLTNTGNRNECILANRFIGRFWSGVNNKFGLGINKKDHVFIVPGNHDVDHRGKEFTAEEIRGYYIKNELGERINQELDQLKEFMFLAKIHSCYENNQIVCRRTMVLKNEEKICINLLNSAIFSETDTKGLLYLPKEQLEELYLPIEAELHLSVLHHSPEWFSEASKHNLEPALYDNSNLILFGHEHNGTCKEVTINNDEMIVSVCGGILNSRKDPHVSDFYAISYDLAAKEVEVYHFVWNPTRKFYKENLVAKEIAVTKKNRGRGALKVRKDFIDELLRDEKDDLSDSFRDYFVFPRLIGKSDDDYTEENEVCSYEDFTAILESKKQILIKGGENAGKTTLLKELYIRLSETKNPTLFTIDDIRNKKINRIIKNAIEEQYSEDPAAYSQYRQLSDDNKIAIIDDISSINPNVVDNFLKEIRDEFSFIILSSNNEWDFNIIKKVKEEMNVEQGFYEFSLTSFFSDKRKDLIRKVYQILCKDIDEFILDSRVETVDNFINNQIYLFSLDPLYIIQYVKFFIVNGETLSVKEGSAFSKVFEANIINSLKSVTEELDLSKILIVLSKIAYFIHFTKKYPLSYQDFEQVVNSYNRIYDKKVNPKTLYENMLKAKIIKQAGESFDIKFTNRKFLAYFVAQELILKFNETGDDSELKYILKNICFGINGDITLFITYLTSNPRILWAIIEMSEEHMGSWTEYSIDQDNLRRLGNLKTEFKIQAPSDRDRERAQNDKVQSEKNLKKVDEIIETNELYDYDESDISEFTNQIINAIKYTEIIAKGLVSFEHMMKKELMDRFIDCVYRYPNKIIYFWLKEIDNNFDELVNDLFEVYRIQKAEDQSIKELSHEDIEHILEGVMITSTLAVYDAYGREATNKNTVDALNSALDNENTNHRIQNIMMLENLKEFEGYFNKSDKLLGENKKRTVSIMLREIARKCLICNDRLSHSKKQHLMDKYFEESDRIRMMIKDTPYEK